jgi:GntP family gluconate:H+ symporter
MEEWTQTLGAGPLLAIAAGAIALLLVSVIVFRMHALLALVVVSAITAAAAGIPAGEIVDTMVSGFGGTLGSVALLIALGAMLGRMVEHSGGAKVLAEAMVRLVGERRAPFGLGIASLIVGFPIFFDAGLVVMLPIIFAVARRLNGPVLLYGIPAAGAFSVMHVFLPPHPGPVAATELFEANLGLVLLIGMVIALPLWYVSGYLWGLRVGRAYPLPVPSILGGIDDDQPAAPPAVGTVIAILALPIMLIFMNTGLGMLAVTGHVGGDELWVRVLQAVGTTPAALLITVLTALWLLGWRRGHGGTVLNRLIDRALAPVCSIMLLTGAGGMFGSVLSQSGIGDAMTESLDSMGIPVLAAAFLIAAVMRVAQGSATVAATTAAGLIAPVVMAGGGFSEFQLALIVLAMAAGSIVLSHFNDSGFWLIRGFLEMDTKTALKTWTVQSTAVGTLSFTLVGALYLLS